MEPAGSTSDRAPARRELVASAAVSVPIPVGDDGPPEWIPLFPTPDNGRINANDGRWWMLDPAAFAAGTSIGQGILFDYDHESESDQWERRRAEASGWIREIDARDGTVFARVEWTPEAATRIRNKVFRFISPRFMYGESDNVALRLVSAALTNRPAFELPALASTQEQPMSFRQAIARALGLRPGATDGAMFEAARRRSASARTQTEPETGDAQVQPGAAEPEMQPGAAEPRAQPASAGTQAQPGTGEPQTQPAGAGIQAPPGTGGAQAQPAATAASLDLVPADDLRLALERAERAEAGGQRAAAATRETEIAGAVDEAIAAGRIAPSSRDYHIAACRAKGGLDRFRTLVASSVSITAPTAGEQNASARSAAGGRSYSPEQLKIIRDAGLTPDQVRRHAGEGAA